MREGTIGGMVPTGVVEGGVGMGGGLCKRDMPMSLLHTEGGWHLFLLAFVAHTQCCCGWNAGGMQAGVDGTIETLGDNVGVFGGFP